MHQQLATNLTVHQVSRGVKNEPFIHWTDIVKFIDINGWSHKGGI